MKVYKYDTILMRHTLLEDEEKAKDDKKKLALYNHYLSAISKCSDAKNVEAYKDQINDLYKQEQFDDKEFGKLTLYIDNKIERLKSNKKIDSNKNSEDEKRINKAVNDKKDEIAKMRADSKKNYKKSTK